MGQRLGQPIQGAGSAGSGLAAERRTYVPQMIWSPSEVVSLPPKIVPHMILNSSNIGFTSRRLWQYRPRLSVHYCTPYHTRQRASG